jgi:hypothetical protein
VKNNMAKTIRIKLPSIEQVQFSLIAEFDDIPVRGNALASGDDKFDKQVEDEIIKRINNGDVWAWCCVEVKATYKSIESDTEYLGACSYADEQDFKTGGYYEDMKQTAYENLLDKIKALSV